MGGWIFDVMYVFFSVFEKVKKYVFACNFLKTSPMELKTCAKKSCNRSGSSPKILSKSVVFSKIYDIFRLVHFYFEPTVWKCPLRLVDNVWYAQNLLRTSRNDINWKMELTPKKRPFFGVSSDFTSQFDNIRLSW